MSYVRVCDLMIGRFKFTLTHVNPVQGNHQDSTGTAQGRCYRNLLWTAGTDPCLQATYRSILGELSGMTWLLALVIFFDPPVLDVVYLHKYSHSFS
jgi:hypothetical protein